MEYWDAKLVLRDISTNIYYNERVGIIGQMEVETQNILSKLYYFWRINSIIMA